MTTMFNNDKIQRASGKGVPKTPTDKERLYALAIKMDKLGDTAFDILQDMDALSADIYQLRQELIDITWETKDGR